MDFIMSDDVFEYLSIEPFLTTFLDCQTLKVALQNGLLDCLSQNRSMSIDQIKKCLTGDKTGLLLLLRLLSVNHVVVHNDNRLYSLTPEFRIALKYRNLIESKIDFANLVEPDLRNSFFLYIDKFDQFMQESKIFDLFTYSRCYDISDENYAAAKKWMRFTTAVTHHEAGVIHKYHDFSSYKTFLDIGGNSGEFVLQICRRNPLIRGTVFDLPVVCEVGTDHIAGEIEAPRINFIKGDALVDNIPGHFDAVSFKSFLHDWPDGAVNIFIQQAYRCLNDDGTLIIYERGLLDLEKERLPYSMISVLLFYRNFRNPQMYLPLLQQNGFGQIHIDTFELETPFFIITAKKTV
jgi:SAM-dependent methyltransferase